MMSGSYCAIGTFPPYSALDWIEKEEYKEPKNINVCTLHNSFTCEKRIMVLRHEHIINHCKLFETNHAEMYL